MINYRKVNKETGRSKWMEEFNRVVTTLKPEYSGRIDWNSAIHLYNIGTDATTAASNYVKNRE